MNNQYLLSSVGLDLSLLALLDLLKTTASQQGWDKPISIKQLHNIVKNDKKLSGLLGKSSIMFTANIHNFAQRGGYQLVYNEDESLVQVFITDQKQFGLIIEDLNFKLAAIGCTLVE